MIFRLAGVLARLGLCIAVACVATVVSVPSSANSIDEVAATLRESQTASRPTAFRICQNQTYALCATARCFVFNELAYCRCDVKRGDSISLPFNYAPGKDVCTANAQGRDNGYMISTFSLPRSVVAPNGNRALYDCPAGASGKYAQCDGGFCFRSSQGQQFPGFARDLRAGEIICACPLADATDASVGFQIAGPYPCDDSFFRFCNAPPASGRTGSTVFVGAPTGTPVLLTRLLTGSVPPLNRCRRPSR